MNFAEYFKNVLNTLNTFRFVDFIDIAVIAFIVYSLFKLVRDTRAEQLVKGIVILLVAYLAATLLDMLMLENLLRLMFEFGVILIVVIFQPEIRNALEQLGRKNIKNLKVFNRNIRDELLTTQRKAIDDVVDSAVIFSREKVGALIVFENKTKLSDIANTGVEINADTSTAILGNLFFNKAPLHDGAVIISNGRIKSAGCILPLTSRNEDVDMKLGTRHRASIGISEVSDATVVVVSEETGAISIAQNGTLTTNYDRDTLREELERRLMPNKEKKKFFGFFSAEKESKNDEKK
ncbi:MAG: diadenylate cyclase CdaA [Ruminococcus sp.]|nr:diadenylate cyclase CdaA [Ruminococcus sp.]